MNDHQESDRPRTTLIGDVLARMRNDISRVLNVVLGRPQRKNSENRFGPAHIQGFECTRPRYCPPGFRGFLPIERPAGVDQHGHETRLSRQGRRALVGSTRPCAQPIGITDLEGGASFIFQEC